jgi:hypothetical protein
MALAPPRPIDDACDLAPFGSGVPLLDEWLKRRARQSCERRVACIYRL